MMAENKVPQLLALLMYVKPHNAMTNAKVEKPYIEAHGIDVQI